MQRTVRVLPMQASRPRARVLRELKRCLEAGRWPAGEALPSERELAAELKATRGTVHLALKDLEQEGLLESLDGRGHAVKNLPKARSSVMQESIAVITDVPVDWNLSCGEPGWAVRVQSGALEAIRRAELHALVWHPSALTSARMTKLMNDPPCGILMQPGSIQAETAKEMIEWLRRARVLVVVDSDEPELADFDQVLSDHEEGSYLLTKWLIERGRRRILRYWQRTPLPVRRQGWLAQRDRGYERAMREAGLEILPPVEFRGSRFDENKAEEFEQMARQVAGNLLDVFQTRNAPDVVMAISDGVVFPLAAGLRLLKKRPNEDVWLVGYDRYWAECPGRRWEKVTPLATVDKGNHEIGRVLVQLLLDRIAGRLPNAPQRRVVKPKLIVEGLSD